MSIDEVAGEPPGLSRRCRQSAVQAEQGKEPMPLPDLNELGDLPEGVHQATLDEVAARFGSGSPRREAVTARLRRIYELAVRTGGLDRVIIFGSYITAKLEPNDVDVVLVMRDEFDPTGCSPEAAALFDHGRAAAEFGASVFWLRPSMLLGESCSTSSSHTGRSSAKGAGGEFWR